MSAVTVFRFPTGLLPPLPGVIPPLEVGRQGRLREPIEEKDVRQLKCAYDFFTYLNSSITRAAMRPLQPDAGSSADVPRAASFCRWTRTSSCTPRSPPYIVCKPVKLLTEAPLQLLVVPLDLVLDALLLCVAHAGGGGCRRQRVPGGSGSGSRG